MTAKISEARDGREVRPFGETDEKRRAEILRKYAEWDGGWVFVDRDTESAEGVHNLIIKEIVAQVGVDEGAIKDFWTTKREIQEITYFDQFIERIFPKFQIEEVRKNLRQLQENRETESYPNWLDSLAWRSINPENRADPSFWREVELANLMSHVGTERV